MALQRASKLCLELGALLSASALTVLVEEDVRWARGR